MRIIFLLIGLAVSYESISCENIIGVWKSSKDMSIKYNNKNANLGKKQESFLRQVLGNLTVTYSETEIIEHSSSPVKVVMEDKEYEVAFEEARYPYTPVSCESEVAQLEFEHPFLGTTVVTLNFINKDTFWVSPDLLPTTREYFVRVNQ